MSLRKRLSSLLPVSSLTFIVYALLSSGSASCGSNQACFYFTEVEYEIGNSCPSQQEALSFFQGTFCSTPITSVDSEGTFDGTTCCYDVTEQDENFFGGFDCASPVPEPGVGVTTVGSAGGIGGSGGIGGGGGAGGTGGSATCAGCAEFLTNTNPPTLCSMSIPIYEAYSECMCNGPCGAVCASNCMMQMPSMECETCLIDATNGCGQQQQACLNDN